MAALSLQVALMHVVDDPETNAKTTDRLFEHLPKHVRYHVYHSPFREGHPQHENDEVDHETDDGSDRPEASGKPCFNEIHSC